MQPHLRSIPFLQIKNGLLFWVIGLNFLFFAPISLKAQFTPTVYDFGKVKMWNNPKAVFRFTNNTSNRTLFLPIQYQRNLYIHIPEGYIAPGESVSIEAVFYTEESGSFNINQPLYLSGSDEPIYLRMQGKILSFHPDAKTTCPPIEHKDNPSPKIANATITVYDKSTGLAINGVDILLVGATNNFFIEHTKKLKLPLNGVPLGLYQIDISKPGYNPIQNIQYINPNTGDLVFELEPIPGKTTTIAQDEPSGDDRIIKIDKLQESDQDAIERIRKMMDEKFKGRKIFERDVIVVNESTDSLEVEIAKEPDPEVPRKNLELLSDFDETGKLNSEKYAANNIVFLIDVSGSMKIDDKLESLKLAMKNMVEILRVEDKVTIIIYSTKARIVLESTPGDQKEVINNVIDGLRANGSSYGSEGLLMAYEFATNNFIPKGNNQVILASDGLFNTTEMSENDIMQLADQNANQRISTSVVGFGRKAEAILFMRNLAQNGGGNFIQIIDQQAAESALVVEIMQNAMLR